MISSSFTELKQVLAFNLRALRTRKKLTQEEAAELTGLNWRHWQKLEAAEVNITLSSLARICQGLGVEIKMLFAPIKE